MNEQPMTPRCLHCGWSRADHDTHWAWACADYEQVESFTGPFAPEVERILAQALRLVRDSTSGYAANVAHRALVEAKVPDPPDEGWMLHGPPASRLPEPEGEGDGDSHRRLVDIMAMSGAALAAAGEGEDRTCHEDMGSDPCGKPAVGERIDPAYGESYPVCSRHLRPPFTVTEAAGEGEGR